MEAARPLRSAKTFAEVNADASDQLAILTSSAPGACWVRCHAMRPSISLTGVDRADTQICDAVRFSVDERPS